MHFLFESCVSQAIMRMARCGTGHPSQSPAEPSLTHASAVKASLCGFSRYGEGTGAFLLPVYGGGELPQAFCRVAAVADALYVLRQGIEKFVMDADTGLCRALRTSSGQVK